MIENTRVACEPIKFSFTFLVTILVIIFTYKINTIEAKPQCFLTAWPSEQSSLVPDPSLLRGKLANGFRYVVKKNSEPKSRVALYLYIGTGSLYEKDNERGVAHLLEHLLFNGTTHFAPGKLIDYFQQAGMEYGNDTNAQTSYDQTVYQLILPDGREDTLGKGLLVMHDFARGALLLDKEIIQEREVVLAEKRTRDSADYRTYVATTQAALAGSKLARRMVIGEESVLRHADSRLLRSFYDTWYRPDNMILVLVGDVSPSQAQTHIQKEFGTMASPPLAKDFSCPEFGRLDHDSKTFFYHYEPELGYTQISLETFWDLIPENDSIELERRELSRFLGSLILSYRFRKLQEDPNYPLSRGSNYYGDMANRVGYATITGQSRGGKWQQGLRELVNNLQQVMLYGFQSGELERAKSEIVSQLEEAVLTVDSMDSRAIARDIIRHLTSNRVYQSPQQQLAIYGDLIQKISLQEVASEFRKIWQKPYRFISVVGDAVIDTDGKQQIAKQYEEAIAGKIAKQESIREDKFPYLTKQPGRSLPLPVHVASVEADRYVFANGLILNIKKTDFSHNRFQAATIFGMGEKDEPAPGMALFLENIVNDSGTKRLPKSSLERLLSSSSVALRFSIAESSFLWTGGGLFRDFEQFVQLLQSRLYDPGFRPNIFKNTRLNIEMMYNQLKQDVNGATALEVQRFLASYNPHFGLPPWDDLKNIGYPEIEAWFEKSIRNPKDLEISVVGDVNPERVVEIINSYLGGIPLQPPADMDNPIVTFPRGKELDVQVDTAVEKSLVTIAWPTEDFWQIRKTRGLQLLAAVFEDRLRKKIREELGLAYDPMVASYGSKVYKNYGYMMAQATVEPEAADTVAGEIGKIARQLVEDGVRDEELKRLRPPFLTSLKETVQSNNYWLYSVLVQSSRHPEQFIWPTTLFEDYTSISAAELSELAREYLQPASAATVRVVANTKRVNSDYPE